MANQNVVKDISSAFKELADSPEKNYVLGIMQGILICREQEKKAVPSPFQEKAG